MRLRRLPDNPVEYDCEAETLSAAQSAARAERLLVLLRLEAHEQLAAT